VDSSELQWKSGGIPVEKHWNPWGTGKTSLGGYGDSDEGI